MFIHRGESLSGNNSSTQHRSRVPDLIIQEGDGSYSPLPCIQVTQVLDNDLEDTTQASLSSPRRISTSDAPLGTHSPSSSPRGSLSLCGRSSRRVSLIPGEALEQAQAAFLLAQAQGRVPPPPPSEQQHQQHHEQPHSQLPSPQQQQKQQHHHYHQIAQKEADLRERSSSATPKEARPSFHCDPGGTPREGSPNSGEADDAREGQNEARTEDVASTAEADKKAGGDPLSPQSNSSIWRMGKHQFSKVVHFIGIDDSSSKGHHQDYNLQSSTPSNPGMKSNQRWLKLRTTVQLSGALSSSMNRNKPPLKREDSFIKRFSTRQIAELQDTVDQTDEEDVSRNSTGSPKLRKKRRKRQPRTVINPYGNVYFYWLCVLTICVLYNLWTSIVREAFPELNIRPQPLWYLLDAISDLIILLDIVVQFRTGYLEQGLIVYDSRKLANHYMVSKCFMLDLAALLPLEFLQFAVGAHPMLRFPRFVKIYRVYNYYYMVESRTLWPNFWRVLNLVHILLLLAHWFGCFYYMLSEAEHFRGEWTYPYHHGPDFATLSRKYLGSVYWSTLTLTTIGDLPTPETNKENRTSFTSNRTDGNVSQLGQLHWGGGVATGTIGPNRMPQPTSLVPAVQSQHPRPAAEVAAAEAAAGEATGGATPSRPATPHLQITHALPSAESSSRAVATLEKDSKGVIHGGATGSMNPEKAEAEEEESHGSSVATGETTALARPEGPVALPRRGLRSRLIKIKTNAGYVFTIISYLIGVFIFATIVGQVGNVITNRNANRLEFERLLDGAKLYMRHHKVPREMQRRVQRWYDYSWSRGRIQGGGDINTALGLLPDKLKTELALHVNLTTLKKVSIFKECQPEFLHDLVLKMKAYIFTPGDLICRKGEVAREMFIIADGILEVISETGKVLTTMKAGDFFGEIGILNLDGLNKRTADVRSVGYSELFSLSREDVLAAMKDYPEAQEILQSLGRKRLMDARHSTPKSSISGSSSKRGTPSPCREFNPDDNQAKKIVHRLRSDVSALRNAFRRSKGTLREMETYELEPLTAEGRGGSSEYEDLPGVKRILRRMRKEGASGSSETSVSGTRGVLRRMARVTSDDAHINTLILNRNSSPTHKVASPVSEDQGVLGAGLPLLQRLKLLKEKEEREERLRQQEAESEGRSQHSASNEKLKENGEQEPPAEEEPEVVGAGLPLFARLRLLKAKEEKERLEREEKQRKLSSDGSQGSVTKDDDTKGELAAVARESVVQDKESKPSSNRASKSNSTERTSSQESKARDSDSSSGTSDSRSKSTLGVATSANSVQPGQALDRAFGKLLSKKMKASTAAATAVTAGAAAAAAASRTNNIASESSNDKDKALSETKSTDKVNSDSDNKSKEKSACQKPLHTLQVKDKVMRSESFKKAIDEGLIRSTEIKSPTKETFKELRKTDKESQEKGKSSPVDRPVGSSSSSLCTPSSKPRSPPVSQEAPKDSGKAEDKKVSEEEGRAGTFKGEAIPTIALSSTPPPERKEQEASKKKTVQKVDSLKVPDEDVSPPLSSPESNETPERKSLKSILKRMSREDSGSNLLPPKGADLKKLMKAPTVEGFVARRSKFSKSVSFQRQTLSSPPLPSNLADTGSRNARGGVSKGKDGIDKVLTKLGALGLDASPSPPNDTQGLVRKIIHGKLATSSLEDEVELLWAARVEELQQQLARRDETIRQLTHTLLRIQSESQPDTKENDQELEDEVETDESSRERTNHGDSSSSDVVSSDGETADGDEDEDEDEPLFMRCDSIESIIHHTPRMSPDEDDDDLGQLDECPSTNYEGSFEVSDEEQERPRLSRMSRSLDAGTAGGQLWRLEFPTNWTRTSSLTSRPSGEVALDIGSSTDEDIHSLSSDDDHAVPGIPSDYVNEDFVSAEVLGDVEEGACPTQTFSSQDWEVQMLAEELAKKQRGVARQVDRDIEAGRVHSGLVDLHEALISSNLNDLSDNDVLRLEKVIHTERERLRHYARMYSLDEQPVLEQEFTALYRSRSQLLISRSSELFKAGPKQRKLSKLLDQLATLSPAEKFLLDRILYTTARKQQLVRHKSMCDDQLTSHSDQRLLDAKRRTLMSRRSISMCSPSVDNSPILPRSSLSTSESQEDPKAKKEGKAKSLLERRGPPTVSAMLASLQRSVSVMSGNGSRESGKTSPQRNAPRKQEAEPLLRPPQEQ